MHQSSFQACFDAVPYATWIYDGDTGAILAANAAAAQLYGYSQSEFLRLQVGDLVRGKPIADGVFRQERRDGSEFFAEVQTRALCLEGRQARLITVAEVSDRVEAEQRRHQAETKFRELFDIASDAVALVRSGSCVLVNAAFAAMFGYRSPDELAGKPLIDLIASGARDSAAERLGVDSYGTLTPSPFETKGLRQDGAVFEMEVRFSSFVEAGELYRLLVCRDTSHLRRAFQALADSERRLAEAQRIAQIGNWELDLTQNTLVWSDQIFRTFGLEPRSISPSRESFYDFVHPEDRAKVRAAVDRAVGYHQPYSIDHRIVLEDGSERWVHEQAEVAQDGGRVRLVGTVQDITDRRLADQRQRLFESVMVNADDAVVIWEATTRARIVQTNQAFSRITGYTNQEIEGKTAWFLFSGKSEPAQVSALRAALETRQAARVEVLNRHKSGREYHGELTVFPVNDEFGTLTHWAAVLRDVSERKRLEAQFLQSQKMEAVGRLAGGVAHDFNNLLLIISGYAHMLRDGMPPQDPAADAVECIVKAAERAAGLTRQLLLFSRRHESKRVAVDLNEVVGSVGKMLCRLIGEDIKLEIRALPTEARVVVDPLQMEQVLMNLAVNARDAMPAGGVISVVVEPLAHKRVRLSVRDTGVGMDEQTQRRIFEPFFTTKSAGEGTGLGLSTVYAIVQQNGGEIIVHSTPGQGSRFDVIFPEAGPDDAAEQESAAEDVSGGGKNILVVEDDDGVRRLIAAMLRRSGCEVQEASGGEEALRLLEQMQPDLMLTDLVMPGLNGWALGEAATKRQPTLKVLYMSGYSEHAQIRTASEPGLTVLNKPFTLDTLQAAIHGALENLQEAM